MLASSDSYLSPFNDKTHQARAHYQNTVGPNRPVARHSHELSRPTVSHDPVLQTPDLLLSVFTTKNLHRTACLNKQSSVTCPLSFIEPDTIAKSLHHDDQAGDLVVGPLLLVSDIRYHSNFLQLRPGHRLRLQSETINSGTLASTPARRSLKVHQFSTPIDASSHGREMPYLPRQLVHATRDLLQTHVLPRLRPAHLRQARYLPNLFASSITIVRRRSGRSH